MSTKRTGASFSVRFLRNGDKITFDRHVYKDGGEGTNLFQIVDTTSGTVAPDWTKEANQPIISLVPQMASGFAVVVTNVTWKVNGTPLSFAYNGANWVWANGSETSGFKARIANDNNYELRICKNLASATDSSAKIIEYEVTYKSGRIDDIYRDSIECPVYLSGTNSHTLQIAVDALNYATASGGITLGVLEYNDNGTWRTVEITKTTLRASAYYSTESVAVGQNGYTMEWYKDGVKISGANSAVLEVSRADVEGGSVFVAKLLRDGKVVAQDGQRLNDISDEYQIIAAPVSSGNNFVSVTVGVDGQVTEYNATYALTLTKNGEVVQGSVSYAWQIYNAYGEMKREGTGATVVVKPSDCILTGTVGSSDAVYADADVGVTAEF